MQFYNGAKTIFRDASNGHQTVMSEVNKFISSEDKSACETTKVLGHI